MKRVIISGLGFAQGLLVTYKALVVDDEVEDNSQITPVDRNVGVNLDDTADDIRNAITEDAASFFEVSKHDLILLSVG